MHLKITLIMSHSYTNSLKSKYNWSIGSLLSLKWQGICFNIIEIYRFLLFLLSLFFHWSTEKLVDFMGRKTTQHSFLHYSLCLWLNYFSLNIFLLHCILLMKFYTYQYNSYKSCIYKPISLLGRKINYKLSFPSYAALCICGLFTVRSAYKDCLYF